MADLKTLLGDSYQDGMTIEQINEALAEKEFVDSGVLDGYVSKSVFDKTASEVADYKKKLRATQSEAETKAQEEAEKQDQIENELQSLRRSSSVSGYEKKYLGLGYDPETASKISEATYDGDMDTVFSLQGKFLENQKKMTKSEIMKNMPGAISGNDGKIDYSKQIQEAQDADDWAKVSSLMRQQVASNQDKE